MVYRPEIDGLRAVAVLSVVFYHAKIGGFPGGFVGVDVFFVISGFLITSLVLKELAAGTFSLAGFWERRLRRIWPALTVMVLATLAAGALLLAPPDCARLGKSAVAQALLSANFFFWKADIHGYWALGLVESRPLLHTWSLAVEEQFYLLFPPLLAGLFAFARTRTPRALSLLLALAAGGSLSAACAAVNVAGKGDVAAFFLPPTRAWELLAGALLAALPATCSARGRLWREIAAWGGLAAVVASVGFYSEQTPFPGLAAVPPVLGAALFIWGNGRAAACPGAPAPTSAGRLLSSRPAVAIGLVSYSLYLWHWPVLVFDGYRNGAATPPRTAALLALAAALSALSWRFVETPFRRRRLVRSRRGLFAAAAAAVGVVVLSGALLAGTNGFARRWPAPVLGKLAEIQKATADTDYTAATREFYPEDAARGRLPDIGVPGAKPRLLLWGDSHAMCLIAAMDALCREAGVGGKFATHANTPPMAGFAFSGMHGLDGQTPRWAAEVMGYVERENIRHVVLAAAWQTYAEKAGDAVFTAALTDTLRRLARGGRKVWVLLDVPWGNLPGGPDFDIHHAAKLSLFFNAPAPERDHATHRRLNGAIYEVAERADVPARFIDLAGAFLSPDGTRYGMIENGIPLCNDGRGHLTRDAVRRKILPLLREKMAPSLRAEAGAAD
ncbi:MAG: acyltransferase [Opitutaceae bacterium]|nr:acyltransferase [Opitutaceae bacterium]